MRHLDEAFHILSDYHRQHDLQLVPVHVDKLRDIIVSRGYAHSISLNKVIYDRKRIVGGVKFYDPAPYATGCHVEINYSASLPKDWERVVACKEMCHAIIDEDGDRVTDASQIIPHIDALNSNIITTEAVMSEFYAEVLAMELLMPYELRSTHKDAYDAGTLTAGQLALRYWVPVHFVEFAMATKLMDAVKNIRGAKLVVF